ncbi:DUF4395 domain-containing protein [Tsukamurella sp. 8F]|uniref:DUF4395 domain-containing protein n=1 Tax=unclassified Tsukamurella TaxID=2633480 RepID=UPI0023B8BE9B|nr:MULTISPECIES: DUF4395 domain-containing protein [unclassified Tsukamurella]MDF0532309.1 DUF4395 domain-containing protein [Tsukamurella sp. 8J]MDF0588988.1 DUF4395 domain-containing protein [Tsukamurella sp. 8F]
MAARFLTFPNPVNEYAARATAGLVVVLAVVTIAVNTWWLYAVLALGFLLRVMAGPTLSPFGRLSVHVIVPLLGRTRMVPGPPKRFAQAIGLAITTAALVLHLTGASLAGRIVAALVVVAAFLESAFGLCLGCVIFGYLQRVGLIPASVCEACAGVRADRPTLDVPAR